MTLTWQCVNRRGHRHRDKEINQNIVKNPINSAMVQWLEQSLETVAGGDFFFFFFCRLSAQIIKFIKNQASKLNNQKMSEKITAEMNFTSLLWLQIPPQCVLIITWTPVMWVPLKKHLTLSVWVLIGLLFFIFSDSPSTAARLAIGCCHGNSSGFFTQPGQWEEFDRKHVRADQIPGVSAQGNQRHICESFFLWYDLLLIRSARNKIKINGVLIAPVLHTFFVPPVYQHEGVRVLETPLNVMQQHLNAKTYNWIYTFQTKSTKTEHYKLRKRRIYSRAVVLNCIWLHRCTWWSGHWVYKSKKTWILILPLKELNHN